MQTVPSNWIRVGQTGPVTFWQDPETKAIYKAVAMDADAWKTQQKRKREAMIAAQKTHDKYGMEHLGTIPAGMLDNAIREGWIHDEDYTLRTLEANPDLKSTNRRII